jgi:hypothetical protein
MNKHQSQKSRTESREPPLCKVKKILPLQVLLAYAYLLLRTSHSFSSRYLIYFHIFTQLLLHCHTFLSCPTLSLCLKNYCYYLCLKTKYTSLHHLFRHYWSTNYFNWLSHKFNKRKSLINVLIPHFKY